MKAKQFKIRPLSEELNPAPKEVEGIENNSNTIYQSFTRERPIALGARLMNSSSQCKESIKRGATSSSTSELKYMSMLNKAKLKRMREFGNKVNNQYLYPANKFKTLQNKENQQMEVRKSGS